MLLFFERVMLLLVINFLQGGAMVVENRNLGEFDALYQQTTTIADFLIDKDKDKEEVFPGMNDIVVEMRKIIDETYKKRDKRGMKSINRDFRELMNGLNESDRSKLIKLFETANRPL